MENDLLFPLSYLVGEKVERKGEEERKPIVYPKTGRTTTTSTDPHAHQYKISVSVVKA